ncbi:MAG: leucine-rich repeat domain-containing protein, partial [archaeon]|nr:leucine-rich repeat domain-containing protein [archaeon]
DAMPDVLDGTTDGGIGYVLDPEGVLTISGSGRMDDCSDVLHDGIYVTDAPWGGQYAPSVRTVIVGDGITYIGSKSFYGLFNLSEVVLPGSLAGLGSNVFTHCFSLDSFTGDYPGIADDGRILLSYGMDTVVSCASGPAVTSVGIPSTVTWIADGAFEDATFLESVTIPSSVSRIDGSAFYGCISLCTVTNHSPLPLVKGSESYGHVAYYAETLVNVSDAAVFFIDGFCNDRIVFVDDRDGTLTITGHGEMEDYGPVGRDVPGITAAPWASHASSIRSVVIGEGILSVGNASFYGCSSVVSVTLPSTLLSIGEDAFHGVTSLRTLSLPGSLVSVGPGAFSDCPSLERFDGGYTGIADGGRLLLSHDLTTIIAFAPSYANTVTVPSTVEHVADGVFHGCSTLKNVYSHSLLRFVKGSTSHGHIAFYADNVYDLSGRSTAVVSGVCGEGVEYSLGSDGVLVVSGTGRMDDFGITPYGGSMVTDAPWGGQYASSVVTVVIGDGISSIGTNAFYGCTSIASFEGSYEGIADEGHVLLTKDLGTVVTCVYAPSVTEVTVPSTVTAIEMEAFVGHTNLVIVTIPASVAEIGLYAFQGCTSLETFGGDYPGIVGGNILMSPDLRTVVAYAAGSPDVYVMIPPTASGIADGAFYGASNIRAVTVPAAMESIGYNAFYACEALDTVINYSGLTFSKGSASYGGIARHAVEIRDLADSMDEMTGGVCGDGVFFIIDHDWNLRIHGNGRMDGYEVVVYDDSPVTDAPWGRSLAGLVRSVTVGDGVENVGDNAFVGCFGLTSAVLSDSVVDVGRSSFRECVSLVSVTMASVVSVGDGAFEGCKALSHVSVSPALQELGEGVFSGCTSLGRFDGPYMGISDDGLLLLTEDLGTVLLCAPGRSATSVTIPSTVTDIGAKAFSGCIYLESLTVPSSVTCIGEFAFENCVSLKYLDLTGLGEYTELGFCMFDGLVFYGTDGVTVLDDGSLPGHLFDGDGDGVLRVHEHFPIHYVYTMVRPTCYTEGLCWGFCSCGVYLNAFVLPALGHDPVYHEGKDATCEEGGWEPFETCTRCNHSSYSAVPALGHDIVSHGGCPPTCTEDGWYAYDTCSRCDHTTFVRIPSSGHDFVHHEGNGPTCTEQGWTSYNVCAVCGLSDRVDIPSLGHDPVYHGGMEATCTEPGWYAYETCSRCDHTTYTEMPALGHDPVHLDGKDATCTEDGWTPYDVCSRCGHSTSMSVPALGHDTVHHEGKEATCTEPGWAPYETCVRCGLSTYAEIPASGHSFEHHGGKEATCTENGWCAYDECTICGRTTYVDIPALGHDLVHYGGREATCTEDGWHAYDVCQRCDHSTFETVSALGHDTVLHEGKEPTCIEAGWYAYETCSRCDRSTFSGIVPLGHDLIHHEGRDATCTEAGWFAYDTCDRCGHSTYSAIPAIGHDTVYHEGKEPTCTEAGWFAYETCSRCDRSTYVGIPASGHILVHHEGKEATCTEDGWYAYDTCDICGHSTYSAILALGHVLVLHEGKAPTYDEPGWKPYETCVRCVHTTFEEIPALVHDTVHHEGREPTCTEPGWRPYDTCNECDYTTYEQLPALGHDPVYHGGKDATCTEDGWCAYETCSRCGHTTFEAVPSLGHDLVHNEGKEATCTEYGWETYETCSRCGLSTYVVTPALGHDLVHCDGKEATCTEDGWYAYDTCERCGYTTFESILATGHILVHHEGNAPTCDEDGWHPYDTCTVCGHTDRIAIAALGHDPVFHEGKDATCLEGGWAPYETCSRCGYSTFETVPALGHDLVHHEGKDALKTEPGWYPYDTCSRCGHTTYIGIPAPGVEVVFMVDGLEYARYTGVTGTFPLPADPVSGTGLAFLGWSGYREGMTVDDDTVFHALFKDSVSVFDVSFVFGKFTVSYTADYGEPVEVPTMVPTKPSVDGTEYVFAGWEGYTEGMTVTTDLVFHAVFEEVARAKEHTVRIVYNDGTETSLQVPDGSTVDEPRHVYAYYSDAGMTRSWAVTSRIVCDITVYAVVQVSGSAGDSCTWTLDFSSGELRIEGEGATLTYTSVTKYPWYAYRTYISSVHVCNGITSLGDRVFYKFNSMNEVYISDSVKTVGKYAFYNDTSLTRVEIGSGLTGIRYQAFEGVTFSLSDGTSMQVTVDNLVNSTFAGYRGKLVLEHAAGTINGLVWDFDGTNGDLRISGNGPMAGLEDVGKYPWYVYRPVVKGLTVDEGVTSIGAYAFRGYRNMESVVLSDTVSKIEKYSFSNDTGLVH